MWAKFLYLVWFTIPTLFFIFAIKHQIFEANRTVLLSQSKYCWKQGAFTLGSAVLGVLINILIYEPFIADHLNLYPLAPELGQAFILPLIYLILGKFVGGTPMPETRQDLIQKYGYDYLTKDKKNRR